MKIKTEYIKLSQFLKLAGFCDTGGQSKVFLEEAEITVNGVKENRKGKKLVPGDIVVVNGKKFVIG